MKRAYLSGYALAMAVAHAALGEEAPVRSIPLSEIVSTTEQPPLRRFNRWSLVPEDHPRRELSVRLLMAGIEERRSNDQTILVLRAVDLRDAVRATGQLLEGSGSPDNPKTCRQHTEEEEPTLWLFAHLGTGPSSPPRIGIDSVEVSDARVRLTYSHPKPTYSSCDDIVYQYWAPLGRLRPGHYDFELYDADLGWSVLTRRMYISP